jgi:hypothetical protein
VTEEPTQRPDRASDADRNAVVGSPEAGLADRPEHSAPHVERVGSRAPATLFDFFAHIRVGGGAPVPRRVGAVFGDVQIDLRHLRTDAELIELDLWSVFGDVDVIVAEGVDAELNGWTLLGRHTTDLAPMPRLAGTPRVAVRAHAVFGDLRLRSLAPGESATRWHALLGRRARRPQPPGA